VPINAADRSKIAGLCSYTSDGGLVDLVLGHVTACLANMPPTVRVRQVSATMRTSTSVVGGVLVKLTNGGVISIQVGQTYITRSVTMLSGYEPATPEVWYVYVVRCADGTLYCGTTNDVKRRLVEHNTSARGAKYTRARRPVTLVKSWPAGTRSDAVKAETRFKKLPKQEKEHVISQAAVPRQPTRPGND